jgi:hypothetical protein
MVRRHRLVHRRESLPQPLPHRESFVDQVQVAADGRLEPPGSSSAAAISSSGKLRRRSMQIR